jgi:glycosyltransferase involved in cell wall biosynthesis
VIADAVRPLIALEISPLAERHYTGIANVAKNLAIALLADETVDARFFFSRYEVPQSLVRRIVALSGGEILWWLTSRAAFPTEICYEPERITVGIYPTHKWHRRLFPIEVQIVHDITTLITPQFHTDQAIDFWGANLLGDLYSSDLIVAVSESTKTDIRTYFPQLRDIPCIVSVLASCASPALFFTDRAAVESYVLVLGTLEPRKNIQFILEFLAGNRRVVDAVKFVFVGRWGWAVDAFAIIDRLGLRDAVDRGRIVFAGFVSDEVRDNLIAHARCVLYPSHYEGFGLPILEALSFGTPVITGCGSSLAEAGGNAAIYCDVNSAESLGNALRSVLESVDIFSTSEMNRRRAWATQFNWSDTYRRIRDAAISLGSPR